MAVKNKYFVWFILLDTLPSLWDIVHPNKWLVIIKNHATFTDFVAAVLLSTFSIDGALAGITRDDLQILPGQKPADGSKDVYLGARFENSKQTPYFTSLDANISKEDTYWVRVEIFEKTKIYTIRSTKMNMCLVNMSPNVTMQGCMAKYDNQNGRLKLKTKLHLLAVTG
ncbi:hypothetical protein BDF19DRAFT_479798 [Syncephalis fuscata]|nr:hypothetical protein BDF19DRAFT_479798 [Syncephalis fuscata]